MTIGELREYFEDVPAGTLFAYGLSEPFSWRGSYDEVAFSFTRKRHTREDILEIIDSVKNRTFFGYKGGEYTYDNDTPVHFEKEYRDYSDGDYITKLALEAYFPEFGFHA